MRVRKVNGVYYKLQRNKMFPITQFKAQKLIKEGATELKEVSNR